MITMIEEIEIMVSIELLRIIDRITVRMSRLRAIILVIITVGVIIKNEIMKKHIIVEVDMREIVKIQGIMKRLRLIGFVRWILVEIAISRSEISVIYVEQRNLRIQSMITRSFLRKRKKKTVTDQEVKVEAEVEVKRDIETIKTVERKSEIKIEIEIEKSKKND